MLCPDTGSCVEYATALELARLRRYQSAPLTNETIAITRWFSLMPSRLARSLRLPCNERGSLSVNFPLYSASAYALEFGIAIPSSVSLHQTCNRLVQIQSSLNIRGVHTPQELLKTPHALHPIRHPLHHIWHHRV